MIHCKPRVWLSALILALFLAPFSLAQEAAIDVAVPTQEVIIPEPTDADVQIFHDHITWLASPFLKGRLPGTPEMEVARNYIEYWFKDVGLTAPWGGDNSEVIGKDATSFRQPFAFGGRRNLDEASVSVEGADKIFVANKDFRGLAQGEAGKFTGEVIFVGYGIAEGKDGYASFNDDDDLNGKIVMFFSFEPMNDKGKSKWRDTGWTSAISSFRKARALRNRGAAGVIIVIPPEVDDKRASLERFRDGGRKRWSCPTIVMSPEAADVLVKAADPEGRDLMTLRKMADEGRAVVQMNAKVTIETKISLAGQKMAENVGGLIPGKGKLGQEIIVVGAHIDHLGVGRFGSRGTRAERGTIHPGADDNASGAAALIMMAERLVKYYASLPEGAEARSVLFMGLDAEEQGLHGARHYTREPLIPIERHALMINFDMIGRITEHRLRMDGAYSGEGLNGLITPLVDASPLTVVKGKTIMMASDHAAFYGAGVPILFSIIDPFHDEYHTPRDTSAKINAVDGARVVELYTEITKKVAQHPKSIKFKPTPPRTPNRN
ncbi:MAG: hypothetical protein ACI97A_000398 [Planctomycetota bacterium]|jgi:hypothetical protein